MHRFLLAAACLFSFAHAKSVTQAEPTVQDLAALMGELVVIEVKVPQGANTLRVATMVGTQRGSDSQGRLGGLGMETGDTVRFVLRVPGNLDQECPGEPVDVVVRLPIGHVMSHGSCVPTAPDRGNRGLGWTKHDHVITSAEPELGAWTLLYVRAWSSTATRPATASPRHFEPSQAFTLQAIFLPGDIENLAGRDGGQPPIGEDALRDVPELSYRLQPTEPGTPR